MEVSCIPQLRKGVCWVWMGDVLIRGKYKDFSVLQNFQTRFQSPSVPCPVSVLDLFNGDKVAEFWGWLFTSIWLQRSLDGGYKDLKSHIFLLLKVYRNMIHSMQRAVFPLLSLLASKFMCFYLHQNMYELCQKKSKSKVMNHSFLEATAVGL